jgi:hypothetical protein
MTTATRITEMTPAQIDHELAGFGDQVRAADAAADSAIDNMHRAMGEKPKDTPFGTVWPTTSEDVILLCRERIAAPDYREDPWGTSPSKAVKAYDAATAARQTARDAAAPYEAEFSSRGGWSRFYLVTSSDGHIHRATGCSTCYITTVFGWLTDLSGSTEEDAVAAHGPLLCSVCYPSAPAEWTIGRPEQTAEEAAADGMCINKYGINYVWKRGTADCPVCDARGVTVTSSGNLRKHAHVRLRTEAERAARLSDPKLIGTPEGDELRVAGNVIRTVRTAETAYVEAMFGAAYAMRELPGLPPRAELAARYHAEAGVLLAALATKYDTSIDEARERLAKRVAKKVREI